MLEEKRKDLEAERQRKLLQRLVEELSRSHADLYYQSTSEIAAHLKKYIKKGAQLTIDDRAMLDSLTQRDIELRLSLH